MRLLHAACELAAICEGGMTVEDQVKSMDHKYLTPEEIAAIREFYQTIPLDLDSSVLAVRRDFLRLIDDWQVLMEENQRLREELEVSEAEGAVRKGWQEKLQARTIELFEREKKLVEALRWYADLKHHGHAPGRIEILHDQGQRARDTLKELGIE
jgi:hypothetical protein